MLFRSGVTAVEIENKRERKRERRRDRGESKSNNETYTQQHIAADMLTHTDTPTQTPNSHGTVSFSSTFKMITPHHRDAANRRCT